MDTTLKFPLTYMELADYSRAELMRFASTIEGYRSLLAETECADENETIVSSYETGLHSQLMMRLCRLFFNLFPDERKHIIHNSNRPIFVGIQKVFCADGSVVAQPAKHFEYSPGMNAETTPVLLFEILSPSTRAYDLGTKLPLYKHLPTLRYIIYLETDRPEVVVWERKGAKSWFETTYSDADDVILIENQPLSLRDIYMNIFE